MLADPEQCVKHAFLTPLNIDVSEFNAIILDRLPGPLSMFNHLFLTFCLLIHRLLAVHLSYNSIVEDDDASPPANNAQQYSTQATEDILAMAQSPDAPPHELHLKPRAICSLMRNLSVKNGLVKNKRVIIVAAHSRYIEVRPLDPGHRPHQTFCMPRINFDFQPRFASYTIRRKQFPLKLAYATTFNSSQGLTFN